MAKRRRAPADAATRWIRRPTLVLHPGVAGTVHAIARRIEAILEPSLVHLGGGSVLAARYGHRRPTDVDLWIAERDAGLVADALRRTGLALPQVLSPPGHRVIVERDDTALNSCRVRLDGVEVTLFATWVAGTDARTRQMIARTRMPAATTTEILTGKVAERWRGPNAEIPDRDLYDLVVARTLEPRAVKDLFARLAGRELARAADALRARGAGTGRHDPKPITEPAFTVHMVGLTQRLGAAFASGRWDAIETAQAPSGPEPRAPRFAPPTIPETG